MSGSRLRRQEGEVGDEDPVAEESDADGVIDTEVQADSGQQHPRPEHPVPDEDAEGELNRERPEREEVRDED